MIKMTQSLERFLFEYHRDIFGLLMFGHIELFTKEIKEEYHKWCLTDEGKQYLKGGSKYDENHAGNIALDEALRGAENEG